MEYIRERVKGKKAHEKVRKNFIVDTNVKRLYYRKFNDPCR
jgi:hypothetical protein